MTPDFWDVIHRRYSGMSANYSDEVRWLESRGADLGEGEKTRWLSLLKTNPPFRSNIRLYFMWGVAVRNYLEGSSLDPETLAIEYGLYETQIKWPRGAILIAAMKKPGELGVGDTLTRLLAGVGGDLYKSFWIALGSNCGCTDRQAWLNARYPYPKENLI